MTKKTWALFFTFATSIKAVAEGCNDGLKLIQTVSHSCGHKTVPDSLFRETSFNLNRVVRVISVMLIFHLARQDTTLHVLSPVVPSVI